MAIAWPEKPVIHFQLMTEKSQPTFKLFSVLEEESYPNGLIGEMHTALAEETINAREKMRRSVLSVAVVCIEPRVYFALEGFLL